MPEDQRKRLSRPKEVRITISPELRARLDALPPAGQKRGCPLDKEKQDALLEFWPIRRHRLVAKELGVSFTTALHWYRILSREKGSA